VRDTLPQLCGGGTLSLKYTVRDALFGPVGSLQGIEQDANNVLVSTVVPAKLFQGENVPLVQSRDKVTAPGQLKEVELLTLDTNLRQQ
jgi:hypothetical protein